MHGKSVKLYRIAWKCKASVLIQVGTNLNSDTFRNTKFRRKFRPCYPITIAGSKTN